MKSRKTLGGLRGTYEGGSRYLKGKGLKER